MSLEKVNSVSPFPISLAVLISHRICDTIESGYFGKLKYDKIIVKLKLK